MVTVNHVSPTFTCPSLPRGTLLVSSRLQSHPLGQCTQHPHNALRQWGVIGHAVFYPLHQATLWGLRTGKAFWRRWQQGMV